MKTIPLFSIKTCFLAPVATGEKANSLIELRDKLIDIEDESIRYHFWGERTNPGYILTPYHNSFANWIYHHLHDQILAEQLSVINPNHHESIDSVRYAIIEIIDKRLDSYGMIPWSKKECCFHFLKSLTVIFDTLWVVNDPKSLRDILAKLPKNSIYYHMIDARKRNPEGLDDFSLWLKNAGDQFMPQIQKIQALDSYFLSLSELKEQLIQISREIL